MGTAAAHFPVVILTGARQTGKTTLLRSAFPGHRYTSLDLPSDAALAELAPADFFGQHPAPVVIDEVQYAPGLFRHIKVEVDPRRHEAGLFVLTCATYNGQLLNKADLACGVGVTSKTMDQWLGVLHASGQIELLEPYFANLGKRMVKSPKLYFSDTGLLCFLLGLDESSLARSPALGAIWEAFIYAELRKANAAHAPERSLWFYRDQQGREVDFVVQGGGGFTCIECKWSELPEDKDARWLRRVGNLLAASTPAPVYVQRLIAARPRSSYPLPDGTRVVHGVGLGEELSVVAS
jgi:predicted AAA+ superfamily ATPase